MVSVFPDLKVVYDSVRREILWRSLSLKDVSGDSFYFQFIYPNSRSQVRA